jgi:hypothetical protein
MIKIHGIPMSEDTYCELLAIMNKNHMEQITREQVIYFVAMGWFAMNEEVYRWAGWKSQLSRFEKDILTPR